MQCSICGFSIDVFNESQPVCPACGTPPSSSDPGDFERIEFAALEGLNEFEGEEFEDEAEAANEREPQAVAVDQWVN